jgi:integrase
VRRRATSLRSAHIGGLVSASRRWDGPAWPQSPFMTFEGPTGATLLAEGEDAKTAQTRLGHSDPGLTGDLGPGGS